MAESVPVGGLFETHLTVSDLGRSVASYRDVVGLPVALARDRLRSLGITPLSFFATETTEPESESRHRRICATRLHWSCLRGRQGVRGREAGICG
jgi:hypothetical protein